VRHGRGDANDLEPDTTLAAALGLARRPGRFGSGAFPRARASASSPKLAYLGRVPSDFDDKRNGSIAAGRAATTGTALRRVRRTGAKAAEGPSTASVLRAPWPSAPRMRRFVNMSEGEEGLELGFDIGVSAPMLAPHTVSRNISILVILSYAKGKHSWTFFQEFAN
jgi:hypothetical protein